MKLFNYLQASFRRKKARRFTREYRADIRSYDLKDEGIIDFANWDNPLACPATVTQEMVDFFRQFIRKGDLVIDIGANIGDTSVPMALAAGPSGTTLAFDPNPYVYKILEKNASLNKGKQHIIPLPYAITDKEEELYYISSEASFANGGISATRNSSHGKFVYPGKIKGVNLLAFLEHAYTDRLKSLSFIKIDTEGYDKEIIKSISGLIERCRPAIVAESFGANTSAEKAELYDVIKQHGYDIFYFEDFTTRARTVKLEHSSEMNNWKKTINIYALPVNAGRKYTTGNIARHRL